MTTTEASPFLSDAVEPQYAHGPAARYAYRRYGKTESLPLVFAYGTLVGGFFSLAG